VVVLVEAVALEGDTDFGEDLANAGAALVGLVLMHLRTDRERVVGKRLPQFKHLAGAFTPVVIGRHG